MATTTTNLGLTKPIGTEKALVSVINGNMDIIDSKVGAVPSNASVQGQIDTLNNQIVNNALTVPTAGTGITINDGGYTQIGKLIILNVRFTNDNAISTVGFEVLKSMPTPKTLNSQNYVPVNGYNIGDCFINSSGSLQYNGTLSAGMHMANAVYVCN